MMYGLLLLAASIFDPLKVSADLEVRKNKNGEFIFRKYPPRALAAGEQGSVRFRAEADARGNVLGCEVTQSSGHWRLDRETCELIVNHARFNPALDGQGKARDAIHEGFVNWQIPGVSSGAAPKVAAANPDKIICKRSARTGSLIGHTRQCLTQREWIQYAEQNQEDWGSLQGRKGFSVCGEHPLPPC